MVSRQPTAKQSIPSQGGSAYQGAAGKTRTESVHVVMADGTLRSVELYRAVNVSTHPELREKALNGDLHRLEDGRELRLPFVYHDPEAGKFALVIPGELSHQELKERARLMNDLADDRAHPVPPYVRDCTSVIGVEALRVFLTAPAYADQAGLSRLPPAQQTQLLKARKELVAGLEREVAQKERDLTAIVEAIAANESEFREQLRRLEAKQRDLDLRTVTLERRVDESVHGVYVGGFDRVIAVPSQTIPVGDWSDISSLRAEPLVPAEVIDDEPGRRSTEIAGEQVEEREIEEVEVATPVREEGPPGLSIPTAKAVPPPLRLERPGGHPPPLIPHAASTGAALRTDQGYALVEPSADSGGVEPPPLPQVRVVDDEDVTSDESDAVAIAKPDIDPPPHFLSSDKEQMSAFLDREPWLFVRVDQEHAESFDERSDLLVQYIEVQGYPVVFLVLTDNQEENPYLCREVLDPFAATDRLFLEALSRLFRVHVAFFSGETYLETRTVSAFREQLVCEILELTATAPTDTAISAAEALKKAIETPPDIQSEKLPFSVSQFQWSTLGATVEGVERLAPWVTPDQLRVARLVYSIPTHIIDTSIKNTLSSALKFGIALPPLLRKCAIEHAMVTDLAAMVRDQLREFAALDERAVAEIGLERTAANWERLLEMADTCGVDVAPSIYQTAQRVIDAATGPVKP